MNRNVVIMNMVNNNLFKRAQIFAVGMLSMTLVGCAATPTKPLLGMNQTFTSDGQIQSKQGDYVVRITKMDTKSNNYREISRYGLPVRVTVANLSKKNLTFGPEQVQLIKNGKPINALTVSSLYDIQKKKDRNDAIIAGAMGVLAVSVGVMGALSGDASLAQSTQQQMADNIHLTFNNYDQSTKYTAGTMDALTQQVTSSVLSSTTLKPKQVVDGLVFFEKVKTSDPITIIIQTASAEHTAVFQK